MATCSRPRVSVLAGTFLVLLAISLVTSAAAQAAWPSAQTGTVEFDLAGQPHTYYTYAIEIPENVAEGMAEGALRDRLAAAAGTTEHTATWHVDEPVVMGTIVLSSPTELSITLTARPTQDEAAGSGHLILNFSLSLSTLQLSDPERFPAAVRYYPESYGTRDFYALTEGGLVVTSVERIDDRTLRVQGGFEGTFSLQERLGAFVHNPDDVLPVRATFDVLQVVGTQSLDEVLTGESSE